jgi:hypothetical protein
LQRTEFKPATIVNLLAAAWIQFQLHDWVMHENVSLFSARRKGELTSKQYDPGTEEIEVPLLPGDTWPSGHMKVLRTKPDAPLSKLDESCPAYKNINTAWWDASQMYGSDEATTMTLRKGATLGKLAMREDGHTEYLPRDGNNLPLTGFNQNWWLGLELMHTLFALEHNAICDMLHEKHPDFSRYVVEFGELAAD